MSYEPSILSRKLGFGDTKGPENNSKSQSRLGQGEKPVNGLSRLLHQHDECIQRQDFKLLIDPAIKKGHAKIYRYNGVFQGQPPVVPKDPRSRRTRIWTLNKADLPVPNFKVDKWYVGIPPQREVYFSGLNDNVDKKFLEEMCERYGRIDAIKIFYDPQTKKHAGKGRVTFATTAAAKMAVSKLDHISVMGNIIKAHIDTNTKGHEVHGKPRGSEHPSTRRNSAHESSSVMLQSSSHLPTPSPSILSQSSTDGSVLSPSLLLMKSPASSVCLPADIWGTSRSRSWDKTAGSVNKMSQSGSAFMSPQSVSSGQSSFEPVSPPHSFLKNDKPPPPPPPTSNPPPPPVTKEIPPPPPKEIHTQPASCIKYEDISPDPVFSPGDEEKSTATQKEKDEINARTNTNESCSRVNAHSASPSRKVRSPRIDKNESYSKWEKKKQVEREEKYREKYRDSDRGSDRDRSHKEDQRLDKCADYRHKRDGYYDKRDSYRQGDYDRIRSSRWDKEDYKYRKDRYSTSPRRGDDSRRSDVKDSRSRDPRLRDKDIESNGGGREREMHTKNERDEHRGNDRYSRDPRLKGRNLETSEAYKRTNKVKERHNEGGSSETKDVINKDPRVLENENQNSVRVSDNNLSNSKLQDPRLQRKDSDQKGIYHSHGPSNLGIKDTAEQPKDDHGTKDKDHECVSDLVGTENDTDLTKTISVEEIISSVVAGTPLGETAIINRYSEDAYTVGVETCSDEEEPLPPGDERDVAHEVQLDITRNKIKAAQNAVKKRKLSETAFQDEKKNATTKSKKIQIVLKSVQLNSSETDLNSSLSSDNPSVDAEPVGGWSSVLPDLAADVAVLCSDAEVSSPKLANLPLTEDISPCNSPAIETTSHMECSTSMAAKEPASVEIYSDIEGNEDDNCVGDVNNDDNDDAMSLSSISSNEDTLEVNEPDSKPSEKPKGISVPPPSVVFPPYPPPMFNLSIPPPPFFNPRVPPPPLVPVTVPPPPLPVHPAVPPPPLSVRPIHPPSVPPPAGPPIPVPPPSIPHSIISGPSGFYDPRVVPPFSSSGYSNSGGYGYQKQEQKKPWKAVIIDEVYRNICGELDTVVKRDIFKKLVEASAFKALESWWDNQSNPKASSQTTATSSRNLSMGPNPAATVGLSSNSGTSASTIGPSPFERPHDMLLGLRASLPKLPSFKVKRSPGLPTTEKDSSSPRKRSNTESSDLLERDSKKQLLEEADLEMLPGLESSSGWDKCPHTVSRLEEGERSQSPWQQLDESMDAAPRATIVRITEADERRPSTGSSLYHKVYSSSSCSSESGSDASESEEESEEGSDEESESSESDEESESESEDEDAQDERKDDLEVVDSELEVKEPIKKDREMTPVSIAMEQDSVQESYPRVTTQDSLSSSAEATNKAPVRTVETVTVSQKTNCQVEQVAHMESFHSFHIANIVPDLFKNHEDSSNKAALTESEDDSTENETETANKSHEPRIGLDVQDLNQHSIKHENNLSTTEGIKTTTKLEEPLEKTDIKSPIGAPVFGFQDKENVQPSTLNSVPEDKLSDKTDRNDDVFSDRRPLLSPDKPLAVCLVELDHSYGLAISEEPAPTLGSVEEADNSSKEPPLPGDRTLTESPVVDIITVDSKVPRLSVPKPQFPIRSFECDDELVYEFHRLGIDAEDCHYIKVGFEQLQQVGSESVVDAHWTNHPPTAQPAPKLRRKQKTEHGVRVHVTGCARAEGFYKIDIKEKAKYLQAQRRQLQCQANITEQEQKTDGNKAKQQSREHRAIQRRLQSAVCNEEFGDLLKFNQLRVRKKQLRFAKSGIHDWGLFAMESIAADEMVTEYVGEVIRQPMADIRERRYEDMGIGSSYLFRVDQDTIIDATTQGNLARFINHCCDPNCYAKIVTLENAKKIVIYSKRDIEVNEEITYDYKFPIEDEKIPCLCGVPQCRGTLN